MTDTFEDRLLDVLLDEVREPSIPPFENPHPASKSSRRWVTAVAGIAASIAVVAGVVVVLNRPDEVRVETADAPSTTAASTNTYLTFGDPIGTVYRTAPAVDARAAFSYRPKGDPGWTIQIDSGMRGPMADGLPVVATIDGRVLRTLTIDQSGGKPFGIYFWSESDGSTWAISARNPAVGGIVDAAGDAQRFALIEAFLRQLTYVDGAFRAGSEYESFVPPDRAPVRWTISDDRRGLSSLVDSDTDIAALAGEATTVRGHAAVFDGRSTTWRESDDEVLTMWVQRVDPRFDDGSSTTTLDEIVAMAEALTPSNREVYDALPLLRGAKDERVVVMPPPGAESAMFVTQELTETGTGGGMAGPVGSEGVALDVDDGVVGFRVWVQGAGEVISGDVPACAQTVMVPPPGEPAATVVLDPTCTG